MNAYMEQYQNRPITILSKKDNYLTVNGKPVSDWSVTEAHYMCLQGPRGKWGRADWEPAVMGAGFLGTDWDSMLALLEHLTDLSGLQGTFMVAYLAHDGNGAYRYVLFIDDYQMVADLYRGGGDRQHCLIFRNDTIQIQLEHS